MAVNVDEVKFDFTELSITLDRTRVPCFEYNWECIYEVRHYLVSWDLGGGGGKFLHNEEECYEPTNCSPVSGMEQELACNTGWNRDRTNIAQSGHGLDGPLCESQ